MAFPVIAWHLHTYIYIKAMNSKDISGIVNQWCWFLILWSRNGLPLAKTKFRWAKKECLGWLGWVCLRLWRAEQTAACSQSAERWHFLLMSPFSLPRGTLIAGNLVSENKQYLYWKWNIFSSATNLQACYSVVFCFFSKCHWLNQVFIQRLNVSRCLVTKI